MNGNTLKKCHKNWDCRVKEFFVRRANLINKAKLKQWECKQQWYIFSKVDKLCWIIVKELVLICISTILSTSVHVYTRKFVVFYRLTHASYMSKIKDRLIWLFCLNHESSMNKIEDSYLIVLLKSCKSKCMPLI